MRTIERTSRFKRDYRRESRSTYRNYLDERLATIMHALASDEPLEPRHHDHPLIGAWADCRDWHVRPDLARLRQLSRFSSVSH